jgi:hypothetical protein
VNETDPQLEAPPHESPLDTTFPWPPAPGTSAFDALIATWKQSCLHPTSFFQRMPREDDYGLVILYYLVIGIVVAGIELFWHSVLGDWSLRATLVPQSDSRFGGVVQFLLSPIILLCTLYLVTGACHLVLLLLRGARHGFETSSRVFAFSYGPAVLAVVPIVGNVVAFVWMIALAMKGLREAHQTDGTKTAVAVLLPVFFLLTLLVLAMIGGLMMGLLDTPI